MKEYKTNEELVDYLALNGVKINDKEKTLEKLEKYSYYSIINSYKTIFKDSDNNYKLDVSFEEIFALYEFDKNIKFIFLKYILEIEIQIKTLIGNQISKQYGLKKYLKISNLDDMVNDKVKTKLIDRINKEIENNYKVHDAITHYKDKHGFVPPFVLTKILTFGVMSSYYGLLKQRDRQNIAKKYKISDKLLKQLLKNLTIVRNIAAHSDRLYCFRSKYNISFKDIDKNYKREDNFVNLYMIIKSMQVLLSKEEYKVFYKKVEKELYKLESSLTSINMGEVLNVMGFPTNKVGKYEYNNHEWYLENFRSSKSFNT